MIIYYYLCVFLFCLGLIGALTKKNLVSLFLSIELMLAAIGLFLVLLSKSVGNIDGQILVFFIIVVAAVEAAIGLCLVIQHFRKNNNIEISTSCLIFGASLIKSKNLNCQ